MLRVNAEYGRDYVDYLVPFITHALRKDSSAIVTDAHAQTLIRTTFGLNIPVHACNLVLRRLTKKGYLKREHGTFTITKELPEDDIVVRQADARRSQAAIVSSLIQHAASRHGLDWKSSDAEVALVAYLSQFSLDFLKAFTKGTTLPVVSVSETAHFIVSTFLAEALTSDLPLFERMALLVKGHMLANALLCNDLDSLQKKFSGVSFYLDTPVIMRLLGFWGAASCKAAEELMGLLKQLQGELLIFEHTVLEVFNILNYAEANLTNPALSGNLMFATLRRERIAVADIIIIRGTFDRFLLSHGILKRQAPHYDLRYQIDETILEQAILDEIHYSREKALQHDVNSIRSIFALRKGVHPLRIEDAVAILVTTNSDLASAAHAYGKENEAASEVSTVITDFSLANIAWLKAPLTAPDLPILELMADCYAAMEPSPRLWEHFADEADNLRATGRISVEDHEILRNSSIARDHLMNLTLGSDSAFSAGTVQEILDRTKASLTKEKDIEIEKERQRHAETAARESLLKDSKANTIKKLARMAASASKIVRWSMFVLICSIITLAFMAAAGLLKVQIGKINWTPYLQAVLVTVSIVCGVANVAWGWTVHGCTRSVAERCESWLFKMLLAITDTDLDSL